jgi:hypothetical protein
VPEARKTAKIKSIIDRFNAVEISLPSTEAYTFETDLRSDKRIKLVEPNYIFYTDATEPNDPLIKDMWFLNMIHAFDAWDLNRGSSEIIVAVIDTGIFIQHDDLADNILAQRGYDFGADDRDPSPEPLPNDSINSLLFENHVGEFQIAKQKATHCEIHGTHVAGIIGAIGNSHRGVVGVNWTVKLLPIKCSSSAESGFTTAKLLKAIEFALKEEARVINMSWGNYTESNAIKGAIQDAKEQALFLAAAGNDTTDNDYKHHYPSGFNTLPNLISVAATDMKDTLAKFSNYGINSVDISAPGTNILSTVPTYNQSFISTYDVLVGTSMATPLVSGAAALVLARDNKLRPQEVKAILVKTADNIEGIKQRVPGGRRLNLHRALSPPLPSGQENKVMSIHKKYKLFLSAQATSYIAPPHGDNPIPFEYIISTADSMNENDLVESINNITADRIRCEKIERLPPKSRHIFLVRGKTSLSTVETAKLIGEVHGINWVERNEVYKPERTTGF